MSAPTPTPDPHYTAAPLRHLVKNILHPCTTLADRVRVLRRKRRKRVVETTEVQP